MKTVQVILKARNLEVDLEEHFKGRRFSLDTDTKHQVYLIRSVMRRFTDLLLYHSISSNITASVPDSNGVCIITMPGEIYNDIKSSDLFDKFEEAIRTVSIIRKKTLHTFRSNILHITSNRNEAEQIMDKVERLYITSEDELRKAFVMKVMEIESVVA